MKRSLIRENIFVLIFMTEFNPPEDMPEKIRLYLESPEKTADPEARQEIEEKFAIIQPLIPEIDAKIEAHSEKWSIDRMGKVELSILRLAVYELLYDDSIPEKVAINEAVELAKKYGQDNAGSFVNGILSGVIKEKE